MTTQALSLSQLVTRLGNAIRMSPDLRGAWVTAELSDVRGSGGHCYLELVEKDLSGATTAKLRGVIWRGTFDALRRKFYAATGRDITSGLKVMVRGSVTYHNLYGISFTIDDIDPSYTLGDIERIRREILMRLTQEGVIGLNKNIGMPEAPQRIAVISAEGAAGYGDFINQLKHNPAGVKVYTMLFPAVMQGERTPESVCNALDVVEATIDLWDCVVIIRGGGATTDLIGFDNYDLARRVATFPLPVIVGIGHERDRTVLDEIACVRCKTPTAAAEYLINRLSEAAARVENLINSIIRYASDSVKGETRRLDNLAALIPQTASLKIMKEKMRLERMMSAISIKTSANITARQRLIQDFASRLPYIAKGALERWRVKFSHIEGMIRVLSPESVLSRGYSITRAEGHAVKDASQLTPGTEIETTLLKGKVRSRIVSNEE